MLGDTDNIMMLYPDSTEHVSALKNCHPMCKKKKQLNKQRAQVKCYFTGLIHDTNFGNK